MKKEQIKDAIKILTKAKINLNCNDYVNIWGERLGKHIWFQEGTDILRLCNSGLSKDQYDSFLDYILKKFT